MKQGIPYTLLIIVIHQLIFQGMFVLKNILLSKKIGKSIRGKNKEANFSIAFFILFIGAAAGLSTLDQAPAQIHLLGKTVAIISGLGLLLLNLIISGASLMNLKDSWRVGVIDNQKTELVTAGIYQFTRNPYFVSYFLMFAAYTIILQNLLLLVLSVIGFFFVHYMIIKEEKYLSSIHGQAYLQYKSKVARYLIL